MSFKNLVDLRLSYRSLADDVAENFYIPCLKEAREYKRAVGFFSSNILLQISKGLGAFADHNGKMKLLVSTKLSKDDYDAIKSGYDIRELLKNQVINNFSFDIEFEQKEKRLKMLAYMIANNLLDIKIVATKDQSDTSMFHVKVGIMRDEENNYIAFSGSGNETENAFYNNFEEFDVFCSWSSEESQKRISDKEFNFDLIWENRFPYLVTIPFPEVIKNKILTFSSKEKENFSQVDKEFISNLILKKHEHKDPSYQNISLRDYQQSAIDNWVANEYRGIFDMATGTGKTYTGAAALCRLFKDKGRLIAIICAPFTHLVDQWCEELEKFNIDAIKCYGSTNYEKKLLRALTNFKQKRINFVCAVICNASFQKDTIQEAIRKNLNDVLLMVDEAHNFGAEKISKTLEYDYPYRLALSATIDRKNDEEGTKRIFDFFGEKCIEYSLEKAIEEDKLTPYKYYPIPVSLTEDEYAYYAELSDKISKARAKEANSSSLKDASEYLKNLLIKRSRIIAGAQNKIDALIDALTPYRLENNMLIYCGAVKYGDTGYDKALEDKKQIEVVLKTIDEKLNIYAAKFTAEENTEQRKNILNAFKNKDIQALVAIKCLDEGMNIPAINRAFILASSSNPKEYIQRRGRVLRKAENKSYAEIFDFITLPIQMDGNKCSTYSSMDKNLVRKELNRVIEFARISMNPSYSAKLINDLNEYFDMDIIEEDEKYYD